MKFSLTLIFFCLHIHFALAQSGIFELCVEPDFDSPLQAVVCDSGGTIYAAGGGSFGFFRQGRVLQIDPSGHVTGNMDVYWSDNNYLTDIIRLRNGNFVACGYASNCDLPGNTGALCQFSSGLVLQWEKTLNPDMTWPPSDNMLQEVIEMSNGNLLLRADSTLYCTNSLGDSLWMQIYPGTIRGIAESFNGNAVIACDSNLLVLDNNGIVLNQIYFPFIITSLLALEDSSYVIAGGGDLRKLDTLFATVAVNNMAVLNLSAENISSTENKIWVANGDGSRLGSFGLNLAFLDSFNLQPAPVSIHDITATDSTVTLAGEEINQRKYNFLKTVSVRGADSYRNTDAAITGIYFDTVYAYHPSFLPPGVHSIRFLPVVTVQNTGSETLNSFNLNAHSILPAPCGPNELLKRVSNITLLPGQSMQVSLDTLEEFGINFTLPFTYTFCAWVSCPDSASDKVHGNDYLCDSFVVTYIVGVESVELEKEISIYPNPSDFFQIESEVKINSIELLDVQGRILFNKKIKEDKSTIDLSAFQEGVYFLKLNLDKGIVVKKIIVRHY